MAPLIVISNMYLYTGAQQRLNVGSYYSHGRYPDSPGKGGSSLFLPGNLFILGFTIKYFFAAITKAVVLHIHSAAITVLSLI